MLDLGTQLRDYLDATAPAVDLEDVVTAAAGDDPVRPRRPQAPPRPIQAWLSAAAAAIVVLLLVGGITWLLASGQPEEPASSTTVAPTTVAPTTAAPTTAAPTTLAPAPVQLPVSRDLAVTWSEAQLAEGELLPWEFFEVDWRRPTAVLARVFPALTNVSVATDGAWTLVAGARSDGTSVLYMSEDRETWSEVDHSALPTSGRLEVLATTRGGLTMFNNEQIGEPGDVLFALVAEDQLIDVHDPPWDSTDGGSLSRVGSAAPPIIRLVETSFGVTASRYEGEPVDGPDDLPKPFAGRIRYAWSYLGSGQWSARVEIPPGEQTRVGDTVLMFDLTHATCCDGDPVLGTSLWALLASNDGINWTEIGSYLAEGVHALEIRAGDSFWVYGDNVGGGGSEIEITSNHAILWISADGLKWQPLDLGFAISSVDDLLIARVAGNNILILTEAAMSGDGSYWVGRVGDQ